MTRNSKPYYRSGHVFVYRKDSGLKITNWDSPDLKKATIGIVGQSPATIPLNDYGLLGNARPYRMQRDLNLPPSYLVDDVIKGEINKILDEYGIPHVPVVEGDSVMKIYRKGKSATKENRGDAIGKTE